MSIIRLAICLACLGAALSFHRGGFTRFSSCRTRLSMSRDDRKSSIVAAGLISASLFGAPFTLSAPPVHAASSLKAELALMKQATPSTALSSSSAENEAAVMAKTPTAKKAGNVASPSHGGGDARAAACAAVREAMVEANSKNTPVVKERKKKLPAATASATSSTANTNKNSKNSKARTPLEERSRKSTAEQAIDKVVEASEASKDSLQQVIKSDIPRAREGLRTAKSEQKSLKSKIARLESEKKALKKNNNKKKSSSDSSSGSSSSSTAAVEKVLDSELSELRKSLSTANAGVDAYGKAVERGENEMFKLRRELERQSGQIKDMREKLKARTIAKGKSDASKRLKASKVALREASSEAGSAMSTLKRSKTKIAGLDVSLRASRKVEATQVKTVNRMRGALQKEIGTLEKEQVRIVGLSKEISSLNIDIAAQEAGTKSKRESLSSAKAGFKAAESAFRSFK